MRYNVGVFSYRKFEVSALATSILVLTLLFIKHYKLISETQKRIRHIQYGTVNGTASFTGNSEESSQILKRNVSNPLKILLYTTANTPRWRFYAPDENLKECPVKCEFIESKSQFYTADAIVFHAIGEKIDIPQGRNLNQIWIFHVMEPPDWIREMSNYLHGDEIIYNWTLTYRSDSDVPAVYGKFVKKQETAHEEQKNIDRILKKKTKLVSWIVSRCETWSKREKMVKKLQKVVKIDIYGQCGQKKCKTSRDNAGTASSCQAQLGKQYKFYLALENSICLDYVTEKFFLPLRNNMVPIVYGGADYDSFAPPKSFINARAFPSVEELGKYLLFLDQNPQEYAKYFEWRKYYDIQLYGNKWCDLCKKLYSASDIDKKSGHMFINRNYFQTYENVTDWYFHIPQKYSLKKVSQIIYGDYSSNNNNNDTDEGNIINSNLLRVGENLSACYSPPN